jgi:hypothetical protein
VLVIICSLLHREIYAGLVKNSNSGFNTLVVRMIQLIATKSLIDLSQRPELSWCRKQLIKGTDQAEKEFPIFVEGM